MDISPIPSSFGVGESPGAGGMNWLLDSGPAKKKPSTASLLSISESINNNYSSVENNNVNHDAPPEGPRMHASTEMHRRMMHSSSITEIEYSYSNQVEPPRIENDPVAVDVISQSVQMCTSNIFGLYGIEIWKFDGSGSLISIPIKSTNNATDIRMQQSSSGIFIKRVTQEADYGSPDFSYFARDAFERLTDTARLDHIYQEPTAPGVGLAGALWSESSTHNTLTAAQHGVQSIRENIHRRVGLLTGLPPALSQESQNDLLWREVDALAEDPDQPYDERLQLIAKAGFKLAAGIPFDIHGFRGIVIFYANPHADSRKLRHPDNLQLIQFAAQFIGAAAAVNLPIKQAIALKSRRPKTNWNRLRVKILAVVRFRRPILVRRRGRSRSLGSPTMQRVRSFHKGMRKVASFAMSREASIKLLSEATIRVQQSFENVVKITQKSVVDVQYASKSKGMKWWQKAKGGHASNPPPFNNTQCLWTFAGVWITHALLMWLEYFISGKSAPGGLRKSILGPLGALTTLQYNLTAAPASQPRNAFLSQVVALSVCHFLHQMEGLDQWHRCALAPAIVATTTARLGIIHPPAGAASVVFSLENFRSEDMFFFLGGISIATLTAVVINNLSDKRQYPSTNWMAWNGICCIPTSMDH